MPTESIASSWTAGRTEDAFTFEWNALEPLLVATLPGVAARFASIKFGPDITTITHASIVLGMWEGSMLYYLLLQNLNSLPHEALWGFLARVMVDWMLGRSYKLTLTSLTGIVIGILGSFVAVPAWSRFTRATGLFLKGRDSQKSRVRSPRDTAISSPAHDEIQLEDVRNPAYEAMVERTWPLYEVDNDETPRFIPHVLSPITASPFSTLIAPPPVPLSETTRSFQAPSTRPLTQTPRRSPSPQIIPVEVFRSSSTSSSSVLSPHLTYTRPETRTPRSPYQTTPKAGPLSPLSDRHPRSPLTFGVDQPAPYSSSTQTTSTHTTSTQTPIARSPVTRSPITRTPIAQSPAARSSRTPIAQSPVAHSPRPIHYESRGPPPVVEYSSPEFPQRVVRQSPSRPASSIEATTVIAEPGYPQQPVFHEYDIIPATPAKRPTSSDMPQSLPPSPYRRPLPQPSSSDSTGPPPGFTRTALGMTVDEAVDALRDPFPDVSSLPKEKIIELAEQVRKRAVAAEKARADLEAEHNRELRHRRSSSAFRLKYEVQEAAAAAEKLHHQAADLLFQAHNAAKVDDEIDVHGLHKAEAVEKVNEALRKIQAAGKSRLHVITGRGKFSFGRVPALRAAIQEDMRRQNIQVQVAPWNEGVLLIDLTD